MNTTETKAPTRHANDGVRFLPLKRLRESKTNPRRMIDKKADAELVASITEHGIVQPLLVRWVTTVAGIGDCYEVVAGARRFRCAITAALLEVPCFIREMTDAQALELQIVENAHRKDVNPLDEGAAFRTMIDQHGYTAEAIAQKLNRSPRWVYGRMQLAKLPADVQTLYIEQRIDLSIAQLLTTVPEKQQSRAAKEIMAGGYGNDGHPMSFRQAKEHVDRTYRCTLADAPFDTGRKDLVPEMGACKACPHASNNQAGLFDQVLPEKGKAPALCTLPSCYQKKTLAAFEERAVEVEAKGGKVLRGKDAEKPGGVDLDAACSLDPKRRTYRQLLGRHVPKDVTLVQPIREGDRPEERLSPNKLREAMKKAGHSKLAPRAPSKASSGSSGVAPEQWERRHQERERKQAQMERAFATVLPALRTAAGKLDAEHAWALVILHGLGRHLVAEDAKAITGWLGFDPVDHPEKLLELKPQHLQVLAIELVLRMASDFWDGKWHKVHEEIARACKVDLKKAHADVVAEDKRIAKEATKGVSGNGVDFLVEQLKQNPDARFADLKVAAAAKGLKVFPVMFGRAQVLVGTVPKPKRGKPKKKR